MERELIECVPNFSEGRDPAKVQAIEAAIRSVPDVLVLRSERDPDHNRSVITFAGNAEVVAEAAFRGIEKAVAIIDLRRHGGVHPRIGATDVAPFVPLQVATLEDCVCIARAVGKRVWSSLGVPVYFYEAAALDPSHTALENVRRGGFENPELAPDLGGTALHSSAGACVIGARKLLIAFNVNLDTPEVAIAQSIARKIRASSGGLPFLKAIGVFLASRNTAQVSMNLTDFERTPLREVFDAVVSEARAQGVGIKASELVGLVPQKALEGAPAEYLQIENFHTGLILENAIAAARKQLAP